MSPFRERHFWSKAAVERAQSTGPCVPPADLRSMLRYDANLTPIVTVTSLGTIIVSWRSIAMTSLCCLAPSALGASQQAPPEPLLENIGALLAIWNGPVEVVHAPPFFTEPIRLFVSISLYEGAGTLQFRNDDETWTSPSKLHVLYNSPEYVALAVLGDSGSFVEEFGISLSIRDDGDATISYRRSVHNYALDDSDIARAFSVFAIGTLRRTTDKISPNEAKANSALIFTQRRRTTLGIGAHPTVSSWPLA